MDSPVTQKSFLASGAWKGEWGKWGKWGKWASGASEASGASGQVGKWGKWGKRGKWASGQVGKWGKWGKWASGQVGQISIRDHLCSCTVYIYINTDVLKSPCGVTAPPPSSLEPGDK